MHAPLRRCVPQASCLILGALLVAAPTTLAQLEVSGIGPLKPMGNDAYSTSIAIDGDTLAVGTSIVPSTGTGSDESARVVVFRRDDAGTLQDPQDDTWVQEAVLANPLPADSNFGFRLDLDGDRLIVGAPGRYGPAATHPGAAVIYRRTSGVWSLEDTLQAADPSSVNLFGYDVSLDGDFAVVGAVRDSELFEYSGAAYVFQLEGDAWVQRAKLHCDPSAAASIQTGAGARFGCAVAVDGDSIVVGADGEGFDQVDFYVGAVYVFDRDDAGTADPADDTWQQHAHIQPDEPGAEFGGDVALADGRFIAGARSADFETTGSGSASIFVRDDAGTPGAPADDRWLEEAKFGPGIAEPVWFGQSVDLQGGFAVVSSDVLFSNDGRLHVFRLTQGRWTRVADIVAADVGEDGLVACDGVTAAIGMENTLASGGARVYALETAPWSWLGDALAGNGAAPALFGIGNQRTGATLALTIHDGPPSAAAILIYGATAAEIPFKGGTLVPSPDRLVPLTLDAAGGASFAAPAAGAAGLGLRLQIQVWIVDTGGPQGFSATNALALELH